jgi:uncharacterized protein DUF3450
MSLKSVPALLAWVALLAVTALVPLRSEESPDSGTAVKDSREILARWVETQQILAREAKDWQQGKEILNARIDLVRSEISEIEGKLEEMRATGAEAGKKKAEVDREGSAHQEAGLAIASWTAGLERDLRALAPRLPEPIRTKVEPLFARMPADPEKTSISIAERLQNVVGILNEVNKFNGEVTLATEVRTLSDGKPSEVRTLYVGLAQAYYVSPRGEAGIGRPTVSGWEWEPAKDLAPAVGEAVEILQAKAKPAFVQLPVKIQ